MSWVGSETDIGAMPQGHLFFKNQAKQQRPLMTLNKKQERRDVLNTVI
jgi:hypothetical protein